MYNSKIKLGCKVRIFLLCNQAILLHKACENMDLFNNE